METGEIGERKMSKSPSGMEKVEVQRSDLKVSEEIGHTICRSDNQDPEIKCLPQRSEGVKGMEKAEESKEKSIWNVFKGS